jgi:hypothetical protein
VWALSAAVEMVKAASGGLGGGFLGAPWFVLFIETSRAVVMGACWVGSIYVWMQLPGRGVRRAVVLIILAVFGMLVGPFYILFNVPKLAKGVSPATQ